MPASSAPITMRATKTNSSSPARASPTRAANLPVAWRQAWKAYPVQNGGLTNTMLGPSNVSGCPQQNKRVSPMPRAGSTKGKASAAQPESDPHRDRSPASAPHANSPSINSISRVSALTKPAPHRGVVRVRSTGATVRQIGCYLAWIYSLIAAARLHSRQTTNRKTVRDRCPRVEPRYN